MSPAVRLQLRLARPPQPDAAADARQVRPHALEPRQQVLELRELDLQLRLVAARPRREDVENHLGAIHDAHAERLLQVLALHGGERLVEQHQGGLRAGERRLQLFDLPLPDEVVGSGRLDALHRAADDFCAGGVRQLGQLGEVLVDARRVVAAFTGSAD